ncbi:MAG: hypothetical protein HZB59_11240 [Ignavibacteriales bacterium]|nr:hypothetical protein [Ignavibacteriales bacterium]
MNQLSGFLTPIIALIALWIAYRQFKIQEYRVRLDLYDRRLKIYEAIMKFLSGISQKGDSTWDEVLEFLRDTKEAKFLFKGEMKAHLDSIYNRAIKLQSVQEELKNKSLPIGPEREAFAKQMSEHYKWLKSQYKTTDELFLKYIRLDQ